jgi:hypothetical protein
MFSGDRRKSQGAEGAPISIRSGVTALNQDGSGRQRGGAPMGSPKGDGTSPVLPTTFSPFPNPLPEGLLMIA